VDGEAIAGRYGRMAGRLDVGPRAPAFSVVFWVKVFDLTFFTSVCGGFDTDAMFSLSEPMISPHRAFLPNDLGVVGCVPGDF